MGWTNGSRCRGCGRGNGHSLTCPEWNRSMAKFPAKISRVKCRLGARSLKSPGLQTPDVQTDDIPKAGLTERDIIKRVARVLDRRQRLR